MKNKHYLLILYIGMFIVSLGLMFIFEFGKSYSIIGLGEYIVYWISKVFALGAIAYMVLLTLQDKKLSKNLVVIYGTIIIQIPSLFLRMMYSVEQETITWIITGILLTLLSVGSYIGLLIFSKDESE